MYVVAKFSTVKTLLRRKTNRYYECKRNAVKFGGDKTHGVGTVDYTKQLSIVCVPVNLGQISDIPPRSMV
ncbi:hypothetical protein YYU_00290 [Anaplasma phagocytophilum str. HZ2]|uniref:hypothetical protein n=1 Tax=Anaplasma phagocytophilum TaxID=948 RepID=UPI000319BB4A|nr:hypothetical protein [Anaplasma phagocytophilum]AGR79181.1 hypothetical protein YYU_00290 [Anaplasma phagocytophilum str. HZ2]AGR80426.1 hypothetical protein WSQ_00280 [Anaplasma phagocytophilum str. JM]KJV59904.1 hypothetical protein APHWEB_0464 [Anaplasma phagocytophilum str. Webster]KJV86491.1 hypothetical protein APHNYW_1597 [Anaplasma phagocytophilum str. ApNYW]PLC09685.1 hypothetical protein C0V68_05485 [Anaplasma phagocytophilum]